MSLAELLVVISILALGVMITVPLIAERIQETRLRGAVGQFAVSLRAARMVAVSRAQEVPVTVLVEPQNSYEYIDAAGRTRAVSMPRGVRIVSSTNPIVFQPNGSLLAEASTDIEATLPRRGETSFTIAIGVSGIPSIAEPVEGGP